MKYSNKQESIYVYLDADKVQVNDVLYKIDKVYSRIEGKSKFSFGRYIVKILNDKLSLCDSNTSNLIKTYIRDHDHVYDNIVNHGSDIIEEEEVWEKYIVKKNMYVSINTSRTGIFINGVRHDIMSTYETGICNVYVTCEGVIKLSDKINTWNDISIMKV